MKKVVFLLVVFLAGSGLFAAGSTDLPLLVDAETLQQVREEQDIVLVDFGRSPEEYGEGHIEGAVYLGRSAVWAEVDGIPGMFPGVDQAAAALEKAGISSEKPVVIYDGTGNLWASRLFWALEYLGHQDVHLLDGGIQGWQAQGYSLSREQVSPAPAEFTPRVNQDLLIAKEEILYGLDSAEHTIVDTRSRQEYTGEDARSAKGGHIPGATHIEWTQNVHSEERYFLPPAELAELYDLNGVDKEDAVVTLCQTGVRGAHTYFVLRHLGYEDVALYDGSWAEWGNAEDLPIDAGGE